MTPIGYVECRQRYRYEVARQASLAPDNEAWIRLDDDPVLRAGLRGLDDFELALRIFKGGDVVNVTVLRDGKRKALKITLAKPR